MAYCFEDDPIVSFGQSKILSQCLNCSGWGALLGKERRSRKCPICDSVKFLPDQISDKDIGNVCMVGKRWLLVITVILASRVLPLLSQ